MFLSERNMKRQLFRVKQLADQTFARAEKSEVLSDDLVSAEKRVDLIKQVCTNSVKKINAGLQGQGTDGPAIDKRLKKLPDFQLASTMLDSSSLLGDCSILGSTLSLCGKAESEVASCLLTHEVEVEKLVIVKLQEVLDNDIPSIYKLKKQLNKLTLDMDSAKARHINATRHSIQAPGNTKIESIKDELDEATSKVIQCKDSLAEEMFSLLAKEHDLSQCMLSLIKSQADYHRRVLETLEGVIPNVEKAIENHSAKPVYGCSLEEHLRITERKIALPIETCVCFLLECGLEEEGLFRIAGSSSKVKKLKNAFDAGFVDMADYARDPHAVAGALKQYLREIPIPLMTYILYEDWLETARHTEQDSRVKAMWNVIRELPEPYYNNLRYLIKFLSKLTAHQEFNKMSSQNVAIVMGPNLMWSPTDDPSALGMNMSLANMYSSVVDLLISYADYFFEGEEEFFVTSPRGFIGDLSNNIFQPVSSLPVDSLVNGEDELVTNHQSPSDAGDAVAVSSSSNRSPKASVSPKLTRRVKKPAPPVPSAPKVSETSTSTIDACIERPKPTIVPNRPPITERPKGHERKSSWLSSELASKPSPPVPVSVAHEVESSVAPVPTVTAAVRENAVPMSPPSVPSSSSVSQGNGPLPAVRRQPVPRPNVGAPVVATVGNSEPAVDKVNLPYSVPVPNNDDSPFVDDETGSEENAFPLPPSPVRSSLEKREVQEGGGGVGTSKRSEKDAVSSSSVSENSVSDRPLRPANLPLVKHNDTSNEEKVENVNVSPKRERVDRSLSLRDSDKRKVEGGISLIRGLKSVEHSTNSLDRGSAKTTTRQIYVNLPDNVEGLHSQSSSGTTTDENSNDKKLESGLTKPVEVLDDSDDDQDAREGPVPPPERPEKFDKLKVVPPARPEKSDRLKALIDSKQAAPSPSRPPAPMKSVESAGKSSKKSSIIATITRHDSKSKEKPARPLYSPLSSVQSETRSKSPVEKSTTENKEISSSEDAQDSSDCTRNPANGIISTPRLQSLSSSSSSVPGSPPGAPRKPPRPHPRPPLPPVAKPRSTINTEQTHL